MVWRHAWTWAWVAALVPVAGAGAAREEIRARVDGRALDTAVTSPAPGQLVLDLQVPPGARQVELPVARQVKRVLLDGSPIGFHANGTVVAFSLPSDVSLPRIGTVRVAKELWGGGKGWRATSLAPLTSYHIIGSGVVRYRLLFAWQGEPTLVLRTHEADPLSVAVNGTSVAAASAAPGGPLLVSLQRLCRRGRHNRLELLYDAGADRSPTGGTGRGLASAALVDDKAVSHPLEGWQVVERLKGEWMGWHLTDVRGGPWWKAVLPEAPTTRTDTVRWYRAPVYLPAGAPTTGWSLLMDADGPGAAFVNGGLVARWSGDPPDALPLPAERLRPSPAYNAVAIALWDGERPAAIRSIVAVPAGAAVRKVSITVETE